MVSLGHKDCLDSKSFQIRPFLRKFRMQALFLMQIQNLKSDFRCFDFLLFLGIKSETNLYKTDPINVGGTIGTTILPNRLICAMKFLSLEIQVYITSANSGIQKFCNCLYSTV